MNGFTDKCKDCRFFSFTDVPKEATVHDYPTHKKDGWCRKVIPRGYTNAGHEGGYRWHGQSRCFQFEPADTDQVTLEEVTT